MWTYEQAMNELEAKSPTISRVTNTQGTLFTFLSTLFQLSVVLRGMNFSELAYLPALDKLLRLPACVTTCLFYYWLLFLAAFCCCSTCTIIEFGLEAVLQHRRLLHMGGHE